MQQRLWYPCLKDEDLFIHSSLCMKTIKYLLSCLSCNKKNFISLNDSIMIGGWSSTICILN